MESITVCPSSSTSTRSTSLEDLHRRTRYDGLFVYFMKHEKEFCLMADIIERKAGNLSLRKIETLCTKIAMNSPNTLFTKTKSGEMIPLRVVYENNLHANKKRYFDIFRRVSKNQNRLIEIELFGRKVKSTIGQLNFFRIAFETGIIDLISKKTCL